MKVQGWVFQCRRGLLTSIVLNFIRQGKCYGYALMDQLQGGPFAMRVGALYTLLGRLEKQGFLKSHLERSATGPMRKYYSLTENGRRGLYKINHFWEQARDEIDRAAKGWRGK